jgi:hypothetical protein
VTLGLVVLAAFVLVRAQDIGIPASGEGGQDHAVDAEPRGQGLRDGGTDTPTADPSDTILNVP